VSRMTDERYELLTKSHAVGHSVFAGWSEFVAERQHITDIRPTICDAIWHLQKRGSGQAANECAATLQKWVDGESLEP